VPQGSILGPLLFILYTFDLIQLIEGNGLGPHLYADDTQVSGSCHPSNVRQRVFVVDLRLPERRCQLDEIEQASVKLIKDCSHEVCNKPAPAPSSCVSVISRRRDG